MRRNICANVKMKSLPVRASFPSSQPRRRLLDRLLGRKPGATLFIRCLAVHMQQAAPQRALA
jgi:hypothetical protein